MALCLMHDAMADELYSHNSFTAVMSKLQYGQVMFVYVHKSNTTTLIMDLCTILFKSEALIM